MSFVSIKKSPVEANFIGSMLLQVKAATTSIQFKSMCGNNFAPSLAKELNMSHTRAMNTIRDLVHLAEFGKGWEYVGWTNVTKVLVLKKNRALRTYAIELLGSAPDDKALKVAAKRVKKLVGLLKKGVSLNKVMQIAKLTN